MHPYPHRYAVAATAQPATPVTLSSSGLPELASMPPPQFDGPEGYWSPETLLCAAIADCFILTFRAIARASKFEWTALECRVEGTLERSDGTTRFTRYETRAKLRVPAGADAARARQLLEKSEHGCLVSSSLNGERVLHVEIEEA